MHIRWIIIDDGYLTYDNKSSVKWSYAEEAEEGNLKVWCWRRETSKEVKRLWY